MAEVTEKNVFVVDNEEFDSFEKAMIYGTEKDLYMFAKEKLFYDYGRVAADFIIENKKEIYNYVKTLLNMAGELDEE
jgi:hypothetical protein